jgi:2-oxoglutarate ferredoxin oxidoreductase subunit alpha
LKAFPFSKSVEEFIHSHPTVFIIEQNRDAQMRGLLMLELQINPAKLIPVLNYDGMPITAHAIASQITKYLLQATPYKNELPATII